jgi:hypothetical protein
MVTDQRGAMQSRLTPSPPESGRLRTANTASAKDPNRKNQRSLGMPNYAVTGASGHLGRQVVQELIMRGVPLPEKSSESSALLVRLQT